MKGGNVIINIIPSSKRARERGPRMKAMKSSEQGRKAEFKRAFAYLN